MRAASKLTRGSPTPPGLGRFLRRRDGHFEALTALWCAQFSTFAERINSIDIDVLHRIGQTEEAPDQEGGCFFGDKRP